MGPLLCDSCKYDIVQESFSACIVCLGPSYSGVCKNCRVPYQDAWAVGERSDVLRSMIDGFKFERAKSTHEPLVELLDSVVPELNTSTAVVPIPTIASHIRQRGYDHARLLARGFAKWRDLELSSPLIRQTTTHQRGATQKVRLEQAREAFSCKKSLDDKRHYVLVDDVFTTGATLYYAAKTLRDHGAKHISIAVIARQPVDDQSKI